MISRCEETITSVGTRNQDATQRNATTQRNVVLNKMGSIGKANANVERKCRTQGPRKRRGVGNKRRKESRRVGGGCAAGSIDKNQ